MMGRFFVVSALVMLSCFAVVTRGMRMVLCRLLMVLGCFLGHSGCFLCLMARSTVNNGTPHQRKRSFMATNVSRSVAICKKATHEFKLGH
jgi:hypothetical protein